MFIRSALFRIAPSSGTLFEVFGPNFLTRMYFLWYTNSREELIAWHKKKLAQLDKTYALQEAGRQVVIAREKARKLGIGPMDPRYPDIDDFYKGPGSL